MSKKRDSDDIEEKRKEIEKLGLDALKDYFGIDPEEFDKETLNHLHQKAKIAMQFEREMGVSKRAVEMNYIRVFRMVAEDKEELKRYIKKAIPQYLPV